MSRRDWDEYFMLMASTVRERATCPRRQVGCVIVQNKRVKATGYNGAPSTHPHCIDVGCHMVAGSCVRTTHAEDNALRSVRHRDRSGSTLFTTDFPCPNCADRIAHSGVVEVVYMIPYWKSQEESIDFFHEHGIVVREFVPDLLLVEG